MSKPSIILVVDDDPTNIRLMESILKASGYSVLSARDGEEALDSIAKNRPDAVLLDVMMPRMSGLEVCHKLRSQYETRLLPIIMVTALNALEEKVQALETGADDFLTKPVNRMEMVAKLHSILRVKALHDEVEETRRQLEAKNDELVRLERLKEKLTQMVVHDLKNPLAGIVGNLQLLEMQGPGVPPEAFHQILARTQESARQLMGLILNILDVARMEEEKLVLRRQTLHPQELLRNCIRQGEGLSKKLGVALSCAADEGTEPVDADPELTGRVLANLVTNALKHTPPGGRVEVGAVSRPLEVEFWVRDTGEGISQELLPRVFDKFVVGDESAEPEQVSHGTGLGLTFCKMAVEAHGGRIWVESEPGSGSIFRFILPRRGDPGTTPASPTATDPGKLTEEKGVC
jgi:two-component system sensor histidine kinase/response regulator